MLFRVKYIEHDIKKVYEIPYHFFTKLKEGKINSFCEELFPLWMRKKGFKGKLRDKFEELYQLIFKELDALQR